ncbi:hypothetical protein [Longimicrobium sp.]|uniref:hypothetical protein n=1 Tax=Longimicrobium sp. TaxID=2029185 RepID=UPI002BAE1C9C|nr:hypothetical protein [Longimicrobium sp.]HSU15682.1 hypothetical protein [Longimicrobium sp.]
MKKLSLKVDDITVSSFTTDEYDDVRGTVEGNAITVPPRCSGTVKFDGGDDDCTSGCVCCRFRPAPKPQ